ncbi:MAG: helix-turn-helix domain-containing protein, partial [Pseudomonadota bacterium]
MNHGKNPTENQVKKTEFTAKFAELAEKAIKKLRVLRELCGETILLKSSQTKPHAIQCEGMKCKKVFDTRKLPREAKEQLRMAGVKRVEEGESPEVVAAGMGINRRTIYRWLSAYHY